MSGGFFKAYGCGIAGKDTQSVQFDDSQLPRRVVDVNSRHHRLEDTKLRKMKAQNWSWRMIGGGLADRHHSLATRRVKIGTGVYTAVLCAHEKRQGVRQQQEACHRVFELHAQHFSKVIGLVSTVQSGFVCTGVFVSVLKELL